MFERSNAEKFIVAPIHLLSIRTHTTLLSVELNSHVRIQAFLKFSVAQRKHSVVQRPGRSSVKRALFEEQH